MALTRILLDTSAYSAHFRGLAPVVELLATSAEVVLSPVVLGELRAGFRKGAKRRQNEATLLRFLAKPRVRVVTIDAVTAEHYALLHDELRRRGRPVPINDLWIAASAAQHGLKVVTLDPHFLAIPGLLVECFGERPPR